MKRFIVTPYYGHDCDLINGFNNGHKLDPFKVDAECKDSAAQRAMIKYCRSNGIKPKDEVNIFQNTDQIGASWVTGVYDLDGNELTDDELEDYKQNDLEYNIFFQFIDFSHEIEQVRPDQEKNFNLIVDIDTAEKIESLAIESFNNNITNTISFILNKLLKVKFDQKESKRYMVRIDESIHAKAMKKAKQLGMTLTELIKQYLNKAA